MRLWGFFRARAKAATEVKAGHWVIRRHGDGSVGLRLHESGRADMAGASWQYYALVSAIATARGGAQ
jgi:hypothetical protein